MKHRGIVIFLSTALLLNVLSCSAVFKSKLTESAGNGNIADIQKQVSSGANINEADGNGQTPLMYAIRKNQTKAAKVLIELGANINIQDKSAYSALSYAIEYGNMEIVNFLMDKGANLGLKDHYGYSYLHKAASYPNLEIVKALLKKININEKNTNGETALHVALGDRMYETAKCLIDNGADVNATTNYGSTPLHYVVRYGSRFQETSKSMRDYVLSKNQNMRISSLQMLDYILSKNPNTGIVDSWGYSAWSLAVYYKNREMAAALKDRMDPAVLKQEVELSKALLDKDVRYKIIERTDISEKIRKASLFHIRPIDYSAIQFNEIGFSNRKDWDDERTGVPQTYAKSCLELLQQSGVENKKIVMVRKDESVRDGVVVEISVKKIILNWNYFSKMNDQYLCEMIFTDPGNGEKLFSASVNVTSRGRHRMTLSSGSPTGFQQNFRSGPGLNVNPGDPGWEGTFSGRLHNAADNMAWVVTRIITKGEIDDSERFFSNISDDLINKKKE